jgi:hypothetical protein
MSVLSSIPLCKKIEVFLCECWNSCISNMLKWLNQVQIFHEQTQLKSSLLNFSFAVLGVLKRFPFLAVWTSHAFLNFNGHLINKNCLTWMTIKQTKMFLERWYVYFSYTYNQSHWLQRAYCKEWLIIYLPRYPGYKREFFAFSGTRGMDMNGDLHYLLLPNWTG